MSTCDFIFIEPESDNMLSNSFNVKNMLYLKVQKASAESKNFLISVFFSSAVPALVEHVIKEDSLREILVDIVTKNKISLVKVSFDGGFVFIPTESILYTRDISDESSIASGIVLINSFVIKTSDKINMKNINSVIVDYLSIDKII